MDQNDVLNRLSPPLDRVLAELLLREYSSLEKRFFLQDWEPATLDGGQFCEIAARCIYHVDSSNVNRKRGVNDCLSYVENDTNSHAFPSRKDALQLCRVVRIAWQFRSTRGAIHIDPGYSANEMDSKVVMEAVRWIMCELVSVFWTGDTTTAARAVRTIVTYRVPAVFAGGTVPVVQYPDLNAEDEVLLLLRNQGAEGMGSGQLRKSVLRHHSTVDKALKSLRVARLITTNFGGTGS